MGKLFDTFFGSMLKLAMFAYLLIALWFGATRDHANRSTISAIVEGSTWPITLILDRWHSEDQKAIEARVNAAVDDALAKDRALRNSLSTLPPDTPQPDRPSGQNPALDWALSKRPSK
ncbi:MAG TPA: hypothetical protein VIF40_10630 [Methylosinus sp.]|jgi:hypothetical protein|uniref:hypothetical protein n=1 Tax=Methylosinus sp. TaxID=427 RepID=UPI002F95F765